MHHHAAALTLTRCTFAVLGRRMREGRLQFRYRCTRCGLKSGWTAIDDPERIVAECRSDEEELACPHRGEAIGEHICEQCGLRGQIAPVYRCELHGTPCVKRAWTLRTSKIEEAGERVCFQCPDRPGAIYDADGRLRS